MPDEISIACTLPISAAAQERIRAVDDRIRLHVLSRDAARRLNDRQREVDDPAGTDKEIQDALESAEIWFGFSWPNMNFPTAVGKLRWIQLASAGAEGLLNQQPPTHLQMTNSSGLAAMPIAEWVLTFMLMHAKRMPLAFDQQRSRTWKRYSVTTLRESTIAVIGLGAIGRTVARLSHAFGARVIATRRSAEPGGTAEFVDTLFPADALHEVLTQADYVALCVPVTNETRHMIGEAELAAMHPSTVLINIARGTIVDWGAMCEALRNGSLAAVYTDVSDPEPLPPDDLSWQVPNLFITPHNSGNQPDYVDRAADLLIENLQRYIRGEILENIVDPERGY
jgi:phosphoglycerate dehydrogenase-like enzyme